MNFAPANMIVTNNFNRAWIEAMRTVMGEQYKITFGTEKKTAYDSCQTIVLEGNAIKQIEAHEIHKQNPFRGKRLKEYCKEFTIEYLEEYNEKKPSEKHPYMYYERLKEFAQLPDIEEEGTFDQLGTMMFDLATQKETKISSNRSQVITWYAYTDSETSSPPCLQSIWCRWEPGDLVDVHLRWRSRDLWGAWQSNLVAIVEMLNREVVLPNSCKIGRIVDMNDASHIYERDWEDAKKVCENTFHGVN